MTPRQRRCLDFIAAYHAAHRCSPSYEDICAGIGEASKSGVKRLVDGLIQRGHLIREGGRARNLRPAERPHAPDSALRLDHFPTAALACELEARGFAVTAKESRR